MPGGMYPSPRAYHNMSKVRSALRQCTYGNAALLHGTATRTIWPRALQALLCEVMLYDDDYDGSMSATWSLKDSPSTSRFTTSAVTNAYCAIRENIC